MDRTELDGKEQQTVDSDRPTTTWKEFIVTFVSQRHTMYVVLGDCHRNGFGAEQRNVCNYQRAGKWKIHELQIFSVEQSTCKTVARVMYSSMFVAEMVLAACRRDDGDLEAEMSWNVDFWFSWFLVNLINCRKVSLVNGKRQSEREQTREKKKRAKKSLHYKTVGSEMVFMIFPPRGNTLRRGELRMAEWWYRIKWRFHRMKILKKRKAEKISEFPSECWDWNARPSPRPRTVHSRMRLICFWCFSIILSIRRFVRIVNFHLWKFAKLSRKLYSTWQPTRTRYSFANRTVNRIVQRKVNSFL